MRIKITLKGAQQTPGPKEPAHADHNVAGAPVITASHVEAVLGALTAAAMAFNTEHSNNDDNVIDDLRVLNEEELTLSTKSMLWRAGFEPYPYHHRVTWDVANGAAQLQANLMAEHLDEEALQSVSNPLGMVVGDALTRYATILQNDGRATALGLFFLSL
jgi:hypothetical protein